MNRPATVDEDTARRVWLLHAYETAGRPSPHWGADDRAWATRVARASVPDGTAPAAALAERARHALHRLLPRDAQARRALAQRGWQPAWVLLAGIAGLAAGAAIDAVGSSQRINLLAPPVWGVIAWNLLVYLSLLLPWGRLKGVRGWLARRWLPAGRTAARDADTPLPLWRRRWAEAALPLSLARAGTVMHVGAAALALGLIASLYLRGLVLDYRVGWESTFLGEEAVRETLALLLAPATALTGIAVPDAAAVQALRVPAGGAASGEAAGWIHLYAAQLLLLVVLPRMLLALLAAMRAGWLRRRLPLPVAEPYFQRLLRELQGGQASVQLLAQGAGPDARATLNLRAWLAAGLGDDLQLTVAPVAAYGLEDEAAQAAAPPPGTTLRAVLVDLAATPEADTHGRFLDALRRGAPSLPLWVLADESGFRQRFGRLPERLAERRGAWQALADAHAAGFAGVDLQAPDPATAAAAFGTGDAAAHARDAVAPAAATAATAAAPGAAAQPR